MKNLTHNQIMNALVGVESQIEYIRSLVTQVVPEKEWIDTKEFAHLANLHPKTVSNYAGRGQFKQIKKSDSGHYLIHISELEKWRNKESEDPQPIE
jgi:hypothetical protein